MDARSGDEEGAVIRERTKGCDLSVDVTRIEFRYVHEPRVIGEVVACACGWAPPLGASRWRALDRHLAEEWES